MKAWLEDLPPDLTVEPGQAADQQQAQEDPEQAGTAATLQPFTLQ